MSPAGSAILRQVLVKVSGEVGSSVNISPVEFSGQIFSFSVFMRSSEGKVVFDGVHFLVFAEVFSSSGVSKVGHASSGAKKN